MVSFIKEHCLWFIASFVMMLTVFILIKDVVLSGDDIWVGFYGDFKYIFLTPEHGRFIQSLQMKSLCLWIPKLLHIHPNSMSFVNSIAVSVNIAIVCFISAMFVNLGQKKTKLIPLLALGIFLFYFSSLVRYTGVQEIQSLTFHFAYVFGLAMFLGFLLVFGELLFSQKIFSKKTVIFCSIFSFLAALSDAYAYIGIISVFFAFCVAAFMIVLQTLQNHNFVDNFKNFCKKYYALISVSVCFFIGGIISIATTIPMDGDRFIENNFVCSLSNFYNLFLPQFMEACIFKHLFSIVLFLILFTIVLFKSDKDLKNIFYPLFLVSGIFGFFFMLFFGGTEKFYEIGKFWIWHNDLQIIFKMVLLTVDIVLFGILMKITPYKKIISIVMLIIVYLSLFLLPEIIRDYTFIHQRTTTAKPIMYMAEKMYLFYTYNEETAVLPISALKQYNASTFYLLSYFEHSEENDILYYKNAGYYLVDILEIENYEDRNKYKAVEETVKKLEFYPHWFRLTYIPKIYNLSVDSCVKYRFDDDEKAMKKFYDKGGTFTVEELEQLNFSKLLDKDFVLNKKK